MKSLIVILMVFIGGCSTFTDPCRLEGGKRQGVMVGGSGVSICVFEGDRK